MGTDGSIAIADCTVRVKSVGGVKFAYVTTPATADDGDTVDLSSIFESTFVSFVGADGSLCSVGTANTIGTAYGIEGGTATVTLRGDSDNATRKIFAFGF